MTHPTLGLVGTAAGGVETLRTGLVEPALAAGWQVAVTLTPTAHRWLHLTGETTRLEHLTELPVCHEPRHPAEPRPHPPVDGWVLAPASANSVAKLATGIADNQAMTQLCEALGLRDLPVVVFPQVNAAHARHPAWLGHLATLREAGVHLVYGPEVWPLHEPRQAPPGRQLPWATIFELATRLTT